MPGERRASASWCVMRSNTKLKNLIKREIERGNWKLIELAEEIGVDSYRIGRYLNLNRYEPRGANTLTQYDLVNLAKTLGIKIELKVTFDDE